MKPFCTGVRSDVTFLQSLQAGALRDDEANPYWFRSPLAPLIAARKERKGLELVVAVSCIRKLAQNCEVLLVEGAGGVLVPVTERADIADVIAQLDCEVIIVGANRVGVINHTKLTLEALFSRQVRRIKVVLMEQSRADASSTGNARYLREMPGNTEVFSFPFLGQKVHRPSGVAHAAKKNEKVLARICDSAKFSPRSLERSPNRARPKRLLARKNR